MKRDPHRLQRRARNRRTDRLALLLYFLGVVLLITLARCTASRAAEPQSLTAAELQRISYQPSASPHP